MSTHEQDRKRLIQLLHVGKGALAMSDDSYRDMLARIGEGKTSSRDLSVAQLRMVLTEMRTKGFTAKPPAQRRTGRAGKDVPEDKAALTGKLEKQLEAAGRQMEYADGMASRMFQVAKVEWLTKDQLRRLVMALAYDAKRHGKGVK